MRKITMLLFSLLIVTFAFGKSVTMEQAKQVADKYLSGTSLKAARIIANSFSKTYNGTTTYFVFNYSGGGFVVVSADDAATPILAHSNEGFIETENTNPELRYWLECYSKQIAYAIATKMDNPESLAQWNNILNNKINSIAADVAPLLTTKWSQSQYYNNFCPGVRNLMLVGYGGKDPVGCVATAMGQLMKYYNFPSTGVGSYSFSDSRYGLLTADFGATTYNFANMKDTASSASYIEIATLLYHAGISVNMDYTDTKSGANTESVPPALSKYFNYDSNTIRLANMSDYSAADWQAILIKELNAKRPVYYSGSDPSAGHAWVCDGYQTSGVVTMFHMNWGWSGSSNGYFAIGALNTSNGNFNLVNVIVYGIKPGNPNLIVRFRDLDENSLIPYGASFNINASVIKGTPTAVKLYIDKQLVLNTTQTTVTYPWNTLTAGIGAHEVRIEALNATDTVSWSVQIGLSEWTPEASGTSTSPPSVVNYIHAINKDVVWATAIGSGITPINEFTKTTNGGTSWSSGQVLGGNVYELGNICGIDGNIAFVSLYSRNAAQDNTCGVYKTSDGGSTWTHLTGALQGAASFADNVWFWDENNGMCHGDVTGTGTAAYFEIYTTTNGGTTWTRVPKSNIGGGVAALPGEGGWTSVIQAIGAGTVMFGTNKGHLYITHDRGLHWTISNVGITPLTDGIQKISFKDDMNGLVAQTATTQVLKETHDGGVTWQTITPTGPFLSTGHSLSPDLTYVPGTDNTFVSVGSDGASYSFDGGHSWSQANGTDYTGFSSVAFVNNHCGWTGTKNTNVSTNSRYKYSGTLDQSNVLNPVTNLAAQPTNNSVQLSWTVPATIPLSYNIYRNDSLLANTASLQYIDSPVVERSQSYCVSAVYALGQSPKSCTSAFVTGGIPNTEKDAYRVYPNPTHDILNVKIGSTIAAGMILLVTDVNGKTVLQKEISQLKSEGENSIQIPTSGFPAGVYILKLMSNDKQEPATTIFVKQN